MTAALRDSARLARPWLPAVSALVLAAAIISALVAAASAGAATRISTTTYTANTTWSTANSPYILDGNVTVAAGATLTIEPGVVVKFNGSFRTLFINGTLSAVGTGTNRITFTSYQDDSVGGDSNSDGAATTGAAGQWSSIRVGSTNNGSQLKFVDVRYGAYGAPAWSIGAIDVSGGSASVAIEDANIDDNQGSGVKIGTGSNPGATIKRTNLRRNGNGLSVNHGWVNISDRTFVTNSTLDGLWFSFTNTYSGQASAITNSDITANGRYGITISAPSNFAAVRFPHGNKNNIYANTTRQLDHAYTRTSGVDWTSNYWGEGVDFKYNSANCLTIAPNSRGHLAFRPAGTSGPITSSQYVVGSGNNSVYCDVDKFNIGPGEFWRWYMGIEPETPPGQEEGTCGEDEDAENPTECTADPVNSATGAFVHEATDAELPTVGLPFVFTRTYNSLDVVDGPLGVGWTHSYAASLTIKTSGDVTQRTGDGQRVEYAKQPDGSFVGAPGSGATLTLSGGTYELVREDQVIFRFDSSGRLTRTEERNGEGLTFAYGANALLATVADTAGRTVTLTYNPAGLLIGLALPGGASVSYAYAAGRLTSVTDVRSKVTSYSYDSYGFLATETDPNGHEVFRNVYSTWGRVAEQFDALNNKTTFSWDHSTQTQTVTDPRGQTWKHVYDNNVLKTSIDALGNSTQVGHNTSLNRTSVISPAGGTTTMTYDTRGNVLTVTAPASLGSATKTFTYNARNDVTSVTDARGKVTTYGYDADGNSTTIVQDGVPVGTFAYDASGQLTSATDGNGKTTTFTYDAVGNLASRTDSLGSTTTYTYDGGGRVLTQVDPLGNVSGGNPADYRTTFTYDAAGNVLTETDPLGNSTTHTYDLAGNEVTRTDPNGRATTYAYDAADRIASVTGPDPDGAGPLAAPVTSYTYDAAGNRLTATDSRNNTTTYAYDSNNRLISLTQPGGGKTTYDYDASGNLASIVEPRGNVPGANPADFRTTYTYDAAGRQLTQVDPLGNTTTYAYDAVGNRSTVVDANNRTTSTTFDAAGRILTVTAPGGGVTSYSYDPAGNRLTRTDAKGHITTHTYDAARRRTSRTSPAGRNWTYVYDANGNRVLTVDGNGNATLAPGDGTTTYGYDRANQLRSIDYSDATPGVSFNYDAGGDRVSMVDGAGTVTYAYDGLDRLASVTRGSKTFSYAYDAANNIVSRTYPDNTAVSYAYNSDNQLSSVTSGGVSTEYGYDVAGNLTSTTRPATNGYVDTRSYDRAGRLIEVRNAKNGVVLSSFSYTRDPVGNPLVVTQTGALSSTTAYVYDANDRLIEACFQTSCPGPNDPFIRWTYDQVSNRLTESRPTGTTSYTYNVADELLTAGATTFSYDNNGNQVTAGARTFTYDVADRVKETTSSGTTTTYSYDGDNNRLQASVGSQVSDKTNYLWDVNGDLPELALETDGADTALRRYVYGVRLESMSSGGSTYHYHADALGSIRNVTTAAGAPAWTYNYEPFGGVSTETKNDPSAAPNSIKFAGALSDPTGLYYLRARQYEPTSGRFLQVDPVVEAEGTPASSLYSYVSNRPTVFVDPSGETLQPPDDGIVSAERASSDENVPDIASTDFAPRSIAGAVSSRRSAELDWDSTGLLYIRRSDGTQAPVGLDSTIFNITTIGRAFTITLKYRIEWSRSRLSSWQFDWICFGDGGCGKGVGRKRKGDASNVKRSQGFAQNSGDFRFTFFGQTKLRGYPPFFWKPVRAPKRMKCRANVAMRCFFDK